LQQFGVPESTVCHEALTG
jgi:hypothetical protein